MRCSLVTKLVARNTLFQTFEHATSLDTQLDEVTVQWRASDGEALPGERLKTPPKKDVPLPRHDFVRTRTSGDRVVVRSKCSLHEFVNRDLKKRLDVYTWTTESDFTDHALLFKIITM